MRPKRVLTEKQIKEELYTPWIQGKELTYAQADQLFDTAIYWAKQYMVIVGDLIACKAENINLCRQMVDAEETSTAFNNGKLHPSSSSQFEPPVRWMLP